MAQIDFLCNKPQFIQEIVEQVWSEWQEDFVQLTSYKTIEDLTKFYSATSSQELPICYVCFDGEKYIGSLLIDKEDMKVHPELEPWMANVVISSEYRGQGHAKLLIQHAISRHPLLHLWTYSKRLEEFYRSFGFETFDVLEQHYRYKNVSVMRRHFEKEE